MKKKISLNYGCALKKVVGKEGISKKELQKFSSTFKKGLFSLSQKRTKKIIGFADLPYEKKLCEKIIKKAQQLRGHYDCMVVLGIGGSALGTSAVLEAIKGSFFNHKPGGEREGWLKVIVADNISPDFISEIFDLIPFERTCFSVITKSGTTSETISTFAHALNLAKRRFGGDWKRRFVFITDPEKGFLRELARKEKVESFEIPPNVGGRYSVLTPVGLFPLACAGVNIRKLLEGAASFDRVCFEKNLFKNPAGIFASIHYLLYKKGKRINVFMPYVEKLKTLSDWFAQLWAESLGKQKNTYGKDIFIGPTPVKAKGVTDQHSQLQLYTEGPFDKVITFITCQKFENDIKIPEIGKFEFSKKSFFKLLKAEETGTMFSLLKAGRPFLEISLHKVDEFYIGQIIFMLEVATALWGEFANLNAFNQPGVEFGKIIAKKILVNDRKVLGNLKKLKLKEYSV